MPYYEYHCDTNKQTIEVRHGMDERLETWGELAERAGVEAGTTPADTPVDKLLSAPYRSPGPARTPVSRAAALAALACRRPSGRPSSDL